MVGKSRCAHLRIGLFVSAVLALLALSPTSAQAHGASDPVASSYLARIAAVPAGMRATVVDGDLRMWLDVPRHDSVYVLDYQGAPYLHIVDGRIWANEESQMDYFNQSPPVIPPSGLHRTTRPRWVQIGSGTGYEWHDGRLQALAIEALAPGASFVGSWRIPLVVNGRHTTVAGTLWYRGAPSIAWFWPIAVLVLCVVAAWRLQDAAIDTWMGGVLAALTLFGITLAAVGRDLHGRPGLSGFGLVELAVIVTFVIWALSRIIRDRASSLILFLIAVVAAWEGGSLIPTLLHGYVLLAVPPVLGRLATVICLSGAMALGFAIVRLLHREESGETEAGGAGTAGTVAQGV
jgi:hypothetical protein